MTEIQNNIVKLPQEYPANMQYNTVQSVPRYLIPKDMTVRDEFVSQHKKNGLFERLYNGIKNLTNLGVGSKKAEQAVKKAENGELEEEQARETIDKYRKSQVNGVQAFGDLMSVGASGLSYFTLHKWLKNKGAEAIINEEYFKHADDFGGINPELKLHQKFLKYGKSSSKVMLTSALVAGIAGGIVKWGLLKINRIGSNEYKVDKKDYNGAVNPYDKAAYKMERKVKRSEKRGQNFRNFASGVINGLMMPITLLGGAIAGVPLYIAGNSLNRYFVANKEDKNKSFNGYVENLKSDGITHAALAVAAAVPMIKKARFQAVYDKNIKSAAEKIAKAELNPSGMQGITTYQKMSYILLDSPEINEIITREGDISSRIIELTDKNIFAVKMKQISKDGSEFTRELRENCPPTRTLEEAQTYIKDKLGSDYSVSKLLGVGTVAETYLAKDASGKEVCIKILKEGINKEKILADKEKFAKIIKDRHESKEEEEYLLKNLDDLADGILKELDLQSEKTAAEELAKYTTVAKVAKPIKVVDGAYVMEKAKGISLASLMELNMARNYLDVLKNNPTFAIMFELKTKDTKLGKMLEKLSTKEEKIEALENYIKKIEARTPEYDDITINSDELKTLIAEYQQVLVEQFNKIEKGGKVLHADIHPGNIFIDVKALKNRKNNALDDTMAQFGRRKSSKIFTLIDTGNTINMDVEQSLRSMKLSSYIQNGNVKDIAEYVLDGASLGGKTKEEAIKLISDDLNKIFFDTETLLLPVTNESLITLTSNIMRKHGITPSDTQLNLNKARESAANSMDELINSLVIIGIKDVKDDFDATKFFAGLIKDAALMVNRNKNMQAYQEKQNLRHLSLEQRRKQKNNPNMLKTNSEEHLIYRLKQKYKKPMPTSSFGEGFPDERI